MEDSLDADLVHVNSHLLAISFNNDGTCVCFATKTNFNVFNTNPAIRRFSSGKLGGNRTYKYTIHVNKLNIWIGLRVVELYDTTSLAACVPSGNTPGSSPRKLILFDCVKNSSLSEVPFLSTIMDCYINGSNIVVILECEVQVYELASLTRIRVLPLASSSSESYKAVSVHSGESSMIVIPNYGGIVSVYNCTSSSVDLVCNIPAHKSSVVSSTFSPSGNVLATVSSTGTVIRIFSIPQGKLMATYRMSLTKALVTSISICPKDEFLAVGYPSGSIDIFKLAVNGERSNSQKLSTPATGGAGLMSTVFSTVSAIVAQSPLVSRYVKDVLNPTWADFLIKLPASEDNFKVKLAYPNGPDAKPRVFVFTGSGYLYRLVIQIIVSIFNIMILIFLGIESQPKRQGKMTARRCAFKKTKRIS